MSVYKCRLGHIIKGSNLKCTICGGGVHTEDGKTEKELRDEARRDAEEAARDREDRDE